MLCEIRPEEVQGRWIVLLDERTPEDDMLGVVAHEIAHAWLGHDRCTPDGCPKDCEVQTANLVAQWGSLALEPIRSLRPRVARNDDFGGTTHKAIVSNQVLQ
jgi:hypothetical protein